MGFVLFYAYEVSLMKCFVLCYQLSLRDLNLPVPFFHTHTHTHAHSHTHTYTHIHKHTHMHTHTHTHTGYTSSRLDKHGRVIIYLKVGRNKKLESNTVYRNLLMYTVER
jgi:hypothetical protein